MSIKIKNIDIKNKVILAPMAGITSFSYRKFMSSFGVGLFYTEMISDCGLIYGNKETYKLLKTDEQSDRPLALQLFGGSKETLIKAINILQNGDYSYDILDLNLACPVPKVTKNNGGSSWLKDLDKLEEMLKEVVKISLKPVTVKVRLGFNNIDIENIVKVIDRCGVSLIAIHARTRKELYSGKANYEALKNIKNITNIPFVISGDIFTIDDAITALNITKADGVMVARGGIGNPLLLKEINYYLEHNEKIILNRDLNEQVDFLKSFAELLLSEFGDVKATSLLRGIAPKFLLKISGTKKLRNSIASKINTVNDIFEIINQFKENNYLV